MSSIYTFTDLMNINKFINSIKSQAKKNKIKLNITDDKHIMLSDNIKVSGYFVERYRNRHGMLEVASGKSLGNWLSILVHESCHMDQYEEMTDVVIEYNNCNPIILDNWLDGREYSMKTIEKVIEATKALELDCEKRSVDKIIKYNLPINTNTYIQTANCYIFFYDYLKLTRNWNNVLCNNPKIYKKAKKTWYDDYSQIPKGILQAFKQFST